MTSRVAVSGAHRTGKSTLIADLHRKRPSYEAAEEAYYELVARGHDFPEVPGRDDFELMLECSVERLRHTGPVNVLYDRCPADYLAYLAALGARREVKDGIPRVTEALANLDLIMFVPIEEPDRVRDVGEAVWLRRRVDELLREMLPDDGWGFGARVVEVSGSPVERADQVIHHFDAIASR